MKINFTRLTLVLLFLFPARLFAQNFLFSEVDSIRYLAATTEPDSAWYKPSFDDSAWSADSAIIGYGYGTSGYTIIDSKVKSLYVRFSFTIENKANIKKLNFSPDYDDGFIAYLNGMEIARVNVDKTVHFPPYNAVSTRSHASEYIMGSTNPVLGIYLDSALLDRCLVNGENIMAVHVINDQAGDDLMFIPLLMNITKSNYNFYNFESRYKRLIEVDSTDLPLVIIETDQKEIAYDQRILSTAHMGIIHNGANNYNKPSDPYNEYNGLISIRTRGQSSRDFPKKSYRFELVNENGADTSFTLLGMPKESDWILFGPYTDKSQIRNKFIYDLALQVGQLAPRTRFCELVINGKLEGLYMLTETIKRDKNRVNISKINETDVEGTDVTGGYIFKYDKTDIFPKGAWRTNNREIVYPDVPNDEQKQYLKRFFTVYDSVLNKTNDFLDPEKGFRKYASDSSLIDFIILNEIAKNADAYLYSTYMYKDRDDKDGRMKFGPLWDYDIAFGNSQWQSGYATEGWQFMINTGMFIHRYFQDTTFVTQFKNRWHDLRKESLSSDSIFSNFDKLVDQVKLVRERNYDVWPIIDKNLFGPGYYVDSYENEIEYTKNWISTRLEWLDNNVDKIYFPLKRIGNNPLETTAGNIDFRIYPNPVESEVSISLNLEKESSVKIEIYNMTGQLQHQISRKNISGYVDMVWNDSKLSALKSGMYVAKVYVDGNPCQSLKIIKR